MVVPLQHFASRVVSWQSHSGRHDLPWQNTRDPYRVWLSEVMLQQTQVATVQTYFTRFLARLPTVSALAAAPLDEVMGLWSGLGYYSRARNLHQCAKEVVQRHGGSFPSEAAALQMLPGIGRSTAAAIASLCFGERVAILDANVKRVVTRVLAFADDLAVQANERKLWIAADELLPRTAFRETMPRYTQGMMDLGATVCLARRPLCGKCPVADVCQARQRGTPEQFPIKTRTLRRSAHSVWLLWAHGRDGTVWLQRRAVPGVWAGLYCMPWFDSREAMLEVIPDSHKVAIEDLAPFKHVLTHKDLYLHPVRVVLPKMSLRRAAGQWFTADQWPALGLPAPVRQILSAQACSQPNEVEG